MLASNVEKLVKTLDNHRVEFVIIGGAAAVLHGSAYVTGDLDICYSRSLSEKTHVNGVRKQEI